MKKSMIELLPSSGKVKLAVEKVNDNKTKKEENDTVLRNLLNDNFVLPESLSDTARLDNSVQFSVEDLHLLSL